MPLFCTLYEFIKEIIKLQRENESLKSELLKVSTQAPKGSEKLSQGDDHFVIHFSFRAKLGKDIYDCDYEFSYSWNTIFGFIAPYFIHDCREIRCQPLLSRKLKSPESPSYWAFQGFSPMYSSPAANKIIKKLRHCRNNCDNFILDRQGGAKKIFANETSCGKMNW